MRAVRYRCFHCEKLVLEGEVHSPADCLRCQTIDLRTTRAALLLLLILAIAWALAGCSTPTVTKTQTVEVKVPVAVQPITPAQVPPPPAPLPPRPPSLSADADLLLSKWCESVAYIERSDPLLRISAGEKPGVMPIYKECAKH